jgi:hypothetical protein
VFVPYRKLKERKDRIAAAGGKDAGPETFSRSASNTIIAGKRRKRWLTLRLFQTSGPSRCSSTTRRRP